MTRVNTVFLDIGATLISGPPEPPNKTLARAAGLPPESARAIGRVMMTHEFSGPGEVAERLAREIPGFPHDSGIIAHLWEAQADSTREIEGATQAVETMVRMDARVFLVSNIWVPYYQSFCKTCPRIAGAVSGSILSFRTGSIKPDPAIFRAAMELARAAPGECVMAGDSYDTDIAPALELGIRAAWIVHRPDREEAYIKGIRDGTLPSPDRIVSSIGELPAVLDLLRTEQ
ncbi:MAG TPA: HAD family hydrolase [Candidatus Brocadiia bacterium]|nr:HAD family hydrolase [Candidatus Brocadiia bacterium]